MLVISLELGGSKLNYQDALPEKLELTLPHYINDQFFLITNALHFAGLVSCSSTSGIMTP